MTKPLQTKKRKHPKGVPTPGTWRIWILPAAVSTLLSLAPSFLFGQGDGPQEERFIRDNYGLPVSDAAETTLSGEYLRKLQQHVMKYITERFVCVDIAFVVTS